jgi:hypothetical protein
VGGVGDGVGDAVGEDVGAGVTRLSKYCLAVGKHCAVMS